MNVTDSLVALGLTDFEAEVYVAMLSREPATAYALARDGGWHKANTYKALESLASKGAATLIDAETRLWKAVDSTEFTSLRRRQVADAASNAQRQLADLNRPTPDSRVYELKSVSAVTERAGQMIDRAEVLIVADIFPAFFELLGCKLATASQRGVRVGIRTYEEVEAPEGINVFRAEQSERIRNDWLGEMIAMASDSNEYLVAHVDSEMTEVHQAIYSASPYLSMMATNGIACEMIMGEMICRHTTDAMSPDEILPWAFAAHAAMDAQYTPGRNRLAVTERAANGVSDR